MSLVDNESAFAINADGAAALFLPGVPRELCLAALAQAGGNEVGSGKLLSPESSSALAANAFGWFLERPHELPAFPCLADLDWPAISVELERQMRFPWTAGRHPWLDASVDTREVLIGVESKRFEPFRDKKVATFSSAYDRDVWGTGMAPYTRMRDELRQRNDFAFLDAAQLVKHAFGLISEGRRMGKGAVLLYLFCEPAERAGKKISAEALEAHRSEIRTFSRAVAGAEVRFAACSYREWLDAWTGSPATHRLALINRFAL